MVCSETSENKDKPLNELYPKHTKALEHAKLPVPKTYPTLQESLETIREREATRNNLTDGSNLAEELQAKKQRDRDQKRSTFVVSATAEFGDIYQYTNNASNFVVSMDLPG